MTETELAALTRLIDELNENTAELSDRSVEQTQVQVELRRELAAVERKLPEFVPRRRFRWVIAAVVLAVLVAVALVLVFRVRDADEAERRRAQLVLDQEQDRQNLIRGCERANDQRATLRQIIETAIVPSTTPPNVDPQLAELIRQGQERTARLRAELLALPGVQPVDCAAAFPVTPSKEST
jgi:signal transduction histidine kinase